MKKLALYTLITAMFIVNVALLSCSKKSVAGVEASNATAAPKRTVNVANAAALKDALQYAKPGDEIVLADGMYAGRFVIPADANGTAQNRIMLRGSRNAILDGGTNTTGYVLQMQARYW